MAVIRFTSLEKGGDKDMKRLEAEPERISLGEQEDRQGQGWDSGRGRSGRVESRQGWTRGKVREWQTGWRAKITEFIHTKLKTESVHLSPSPSLYIRSSMGLSFHPFQRLVKGSDE